MLLSIDDERSPAMARSIRFIFSATACGSGSNVSRSTIRPPFGRRVRRPCRRAWSRLLRAPLSAGWPALWQWLS